MYIRKIKKGGKTYLYYYKSQRQGEKVKSIYVGRALEKPVKDVKPKEPRQLIKKNDVVNNLLEFDNLLFEINKHVVLKNLKSSIMVYNEMLNIYSKLEVQPEDKQKIFSKLNLLYEELVSLSREHNIEILK